MKTFGSKLPPVSVFVAMATAACLVLAFDGCKKQEPPVVKYEPAGILLEVQVFSMPRALAVETVLNQPANTDYATVMKGVQALVAEKKAVLVATPTLSAMSGQRAVMHSVLEHRYPTEFSPPQIPQTSTTEVTKKVTKTTTVTEEVGSFPKTPTTPTAFEKRDLGIVFEFEPTVNADRSEITVQAALEQTALQGTVKYKTDGNGEIEQPEFYSKKIMTNVLLKNGGVIFLGTVEPDRTLSKNEDLTEVVFLRATAR